ncbi:hypothetical protein SETIT_2G315200v2 [Setaria italica]|uniref:F-box domain-containing protein n=1 Tax=Setaria italica TaxID=4555 RepID=A0A368Q4U1_SETIT|nr:hypothetical protein SETIT_2G315200v2 [Setaria italica]
MAAVASCRKCRRDQVSAPCCRWGLVRRSRRLRRGADDGEEDRISGLPDDVLRLFLARLGCAHAVAHTGLVSRRWRNLWTGLPESSPSTTPRPTRHHPLEPPGVTSLLRSAARLAPVELKAVLSGSTHYRDYPLYHVEVELPCFDRTTSISISMFIPVVRIPLPRSCDVSIDSLLPRCPRLRKLCIQRTRILSITGHSPSLEELDVTTHGVLLRVDIEAPLLKKLSIYAVVGISNEFSLSYSAPKLEELSWKCTRSFRQLMSRLPVANVSILELNILTRGHAYGELALHLLMICSTAQRLEMKLRDVGVEGCSGRRCTCHQPNNWRSQTVPTDLKEVEIQGFKGEGQEIYLLKVIFRSAIMLERVTIEFYPKVSPRDNRYMETLGILKGHPSVKSTVFIRKCVSKFEGMHDY